MADDPEDKVQLETLKVFQEPQCLIQTDTAGFLDVVKDTADELMMVDMAVNVVAIAGLYRTGKSYLMNRLAGKYTGFALGNSIQSKTKGIWAWCKYHPTQKDQVLLLLDTEGLGDVEKGNIDHDNKLLVLATLLSSTLVYNTMTSFTQEALEKLLFTTEISKNLQISTKDSSDKNIDLLMPEFVLCIRDFSLRLEIDGKKCSEDEYLENCLKEKTRESDEKFNQTRRCIKKYFTKRKAFTFDRPAGRYVLEELDQATDEDLSKDFIKETEKFSSYIYECPPKMLKNKKLVSCRMLTELLTVYVDAIKHGKVPCIDDALTVMCKAENTKLVNDAIEKFKVKLLQIPMPVASKDILLSKCSKLQTELLTDLKQKLLYDDDNTVEKSAKDAMDDIYKKLEDDNSQQLYKKCYDRITKLYEHEVKGKVTSDKYMVAGGYDMYKKDMDDIIADYKKELEIEKVDPMECDKVVESFLSQKISVRDRIMTKVNELEKQRREEEKRRREEELHQRQDFELQMERDVFELVSEFQSVLLRGRMAMVAEAERRRAAEYERLISIRENEIERLIRERNQRQRAEENEWNQRQRAEENECIVS